MLKPNIVFFRQVSGTQSRCFVQQRAAMSLFVPYPKARHPNNSISYQSRFRARKMLQHCGIALSSCAEDRRTAAMACNIYVTVHAQYTLHSTLHTTLHSTLCAPHSALHILHFTFSALHSIVYCLHFALRGLSTSVPLSCVWAFGFVGCIFLLILPDVFSTTADLQNPKCLLHLQKENSIFEFQALQRPCDSKRHFEMLGCKMNVVGTAAGENSPWLFPMGLRVVVRRCVLVSASACRILHNFVWICSQKTLRQRCWPHKRWSAWPLTR